MSRQRISRRSFLGGSVGLSLSALYLQENAFSQTKPPTPTPGLHSSYERGLWLAGDPHVHTYYSKNGQYSVAQQAEQAFKNGLQWIVVADHGSMTHSRTAGKEMLAEVQAARKQFPKLTIFMGVTWNMPTGEQTTVIMPPTQNEGKHLSEFQLLHDSVCRAVVDKENNEQAVVEAMQYLLNLNPLPLVFVSQPARRGLVSPAKMRTLISSAPDVMRGFEGSPGHQAASLNGKPRGGYAGTKRNGSWEQYPEDAYRTYGGFDWMTARVGGMWDALLAQNLPVFVTATANCHRHWQDMSQLDDADFESSGRTKLGSRRVEKGENEDFFPGEYSRTAVFVPQNDPLAIMQGMRSGNMFASLGNIVERCELLAISGGQMIPMGGTLTLNSPNDPVTISIRIKLPRKKNLNGELPKLDHIDIIAGNIEPGAYQPTSFLNPSTSVVATVSPAQAVRKGDFLDYGFKIDKVQGDFYLRLRGTNLANVKDPVADSTNTKPWEDLWFYSNPLFIRLPRRS